MQVFEFLQSEISPVVTELELKTDLGVKTWLGQWTENAPTQPAMKYVPNLSSKIKDGLHFIDPMDAYLWILTYRLLIF